MSRRALIFVHVFLAVQIALPLTYYHARRDKYDERFAWRMFSAERMAICTPAFRVDGTPVRLFSHFHEAWINIARRGRRDVLEAMARRLCSKNPGKPVTLELTCKRVDGKVETPSAGVWDLCEKGRL
ncbi:MAG TPA: hypothetical protein VFU21_02370 [Kofleriaceae bacterium]|nr:hypothetical protein [Kofleriaceae bacterium]